MPRRASGGRDGQVDAGWLVAPRTVLVPDVMVVRSGADGPDLLREAALLVVEVASPSTQRFDRTRKRQLYAAAGAAHYWLVDPAAATVTVMTKDLAPEGSAPAFGPERVLDVGRTHRIDVPLPVELDLVRLFAR